MSGTLFTSRAMLCILAYLSFILGWFERIGDSVFLLWKLVLTQLSFAILPLANLSLGDRRRVRCHL